MTIALLRRRVGLPLGTLALASVAAETIMASIDNSLSVPGGRFLAFGSVIPRFAVLVGGGSLLVAGWEASNNARTKRIAGLAMLVLAALVLIPPGILLSDFSAATNGLGPGGIVRAKVQVARLILFSASLAVLLIGGGRFLVARSRT